ncbi:MAG: hypothetical protein B7Y02_02620, partial [Rhodobacterales bacterium 17-64-5]
MTRALVLYAHPCADSYAAVLRDAVTETLAARGWSVDLCDLYAEGFDPVMGEGERRGYHDTATNTAPVQAHVDRLRAAQALVFVHPVWNFGFPAILKGYTDRVFLPGITFRLDDGRVRPAMTHIRRLADSVDDRTCAITSSLLAYLEQCVTLALQARPMLMAEA